MHHVNVTDTEAVRLLKALCECVRHNTTMVAMIEFRIAFRTEFRDISDEHLERIEDLMGHVYKMAAEMVRAQNMFAATPAQLNTLSNLKHYGIRKNNALSLCETDEEDVCLAFLNLLDLHSILFFSDGRDRIVNDFSGFARSLFDVVNNLHENVENIYAHVFSSLKRIYVPSGKDWTTDEYNKNKKGRYAQQIDAGRADRADRWNSLRVVPSWCRRTTTFGGPPSSPSALMIM